MVVILAYESHIFSVLEGVSHMRNYRKSLIVLGPGRRVIILIYQVLAEDMVRRDLPVEGNLVTARIKEHYVEHYGLGQNVDLELFLDQLVLTRALTAFLMDFCLL